MWRMSVCDRYFGGLGNAKDNRQRLHTRLGREKHFYDRCLFARIQLRRLLWLSSLCLAMAASYIDKLALILVRERKQLVARSRGKAAFFTPGGACEGAESDEDALVRECREELTIDIMRDPDEALAYSKRRRTESRRAPWSRMTCCMNFTGELQASEEEWRS